MNRLLLATLLCTATSAALAATTNPKPQAAAEVMASTVPVANADAVKGSSVLAARPQQLFVGLSVADLKKSQAWYRDLFAMREVFGTTFEKGAVSVLENDWLMIELLQHGDAKPLKTIAPDTEDYRVHGPFKLGAFVPNLDAMLAEFERRDIPLASRIYEDEANKTRNVFVQDPDGNRWQLFQRTGARPH